MKKTVRSHFSSQWELPCREEVLQNTIALSKAAFAAGEAEGSLTQLEFLYQQSKFIRRRWWLLQGALLAILCALLQSQGDRILRYTMGVAAPLFVILLLPELWKNRSCDAMEVECTTFFSLRQIYAARLTLLAMVDVVLLTLFFMGASLTARLSLWDMMVQFLLPFNVTCGICFTCLYSRRQVSEAVSLLLCFLWTGLWCGIILQDAVYSAISLPMWALLLAASFLYMGYAIVRGQRDWRQIMEVKPLWN